MPDPVEYQRLSYPLAVYNFRVEVGGKGITFTEISGITAEYEHVTYRHGLSFMDGERIYVFNRNQFKQITCKRGTVLGADPTYLYDWLKSRKLRSMDIHLCDQEGNQVMTWKVAAAVPVRLTAPSFSAGSNDASIDTLELMAKGVSFVKV